MSALNPIQLDPILELNCQINFHTFELIQVDLEAKYCEPMKKTKCRTSTHREVIVQVKNTLSYPFWHVTYISGPPKWYILMWYTCNSQINWIWKVMQNYRSFAWFCTDYCTQAANEISFLWSSPISCIWVIIFYFHETTKYNFTQSEINQFSAFFC